MIRSIIFALSVGVSLQSLFAGNAQSNMLSGTGNPASRRMVIVTMPDAGMDCEISCSQRTSLREVLGLVRGEILKRHPDWSVVAMRSKFADAEEGYQLVSSDAEEGYQLVSSEAEWRELLNSGRLFVLSPFAGPLK